MTIRPRFQLMLPLAALICMVSALMASAAGPLTASQAFVSAPGEVFPSVDSITRLDMLDYYRAGSTRPSRNLIGGECRIIAEDSARIEFSTSKASEYTLALLPSKKKNVSPVIMVVRTVLTPSPDSSVRFYDAGWNELKGIFEVPLLDGWMLPEAAKNNREDVENAVPFVLAHIRYVPSAGELTLTPNLSDYIPEESLGLAERSLYPSITYKWDGRTFRRK